MRPKMVLLFILLVLAPLATLVWLGARVTRAEHEIIGAQFQTLLISKLHDVDQSITALLTERERYFARLTELPTYDTEALRKIARIDPLVSQVFVLDSAGKVVHPPPTEVLNDSEREFLKRAGHFLSDQQLLFRRDSSEASLQSSPPSRGWYVWFWENGVNLIFWRRTASGHTVGVELERARWVGDVISRLPLTTTGDAGQTDTIALLDSNNAVLYEWGRYEPHDKEKPRAELALSPPLNSWHLRYYSAADPEAVLQAEGFFKLGTLLAVLTLALLLAAVYFYREFSREVRMATQRVSFVNQVSHELKTPLTNIRMYAELLEDQLPAQTEDDTPARGYLNIIVSESQRLSRLIANVLTLARQQKKTLSVHLKAGNVDETIAAAIEQFKPALEARGVKIQVVANAAQSVQVDADALSQILGNLFSNVEKYAAGGGFLEVVSQQQDGKTSITVSDRGPGIADDQRARIFEPFYRGSDKLNEGVSGTGIGLTIARELARLHGGDLTLEPTPAGATFLVILATPPVTSIEGARQ